jgi:hypothetical protein
MSLFDWGPPDLTGWWEQPIDHVQALRTQVWGGSLDRMILRGGPLPALNTLLWCLIGGWIARHEGVARLRSRYDTAEARVEPSATAFLVGWWRSLVACCLFVFLVALMLLLPVSLAGWVNTGLGSLGALVVSLLLPVVLVADLALLFVALGAVAWPLMPITVAFECSDSFDALSRSYSYLFQRPVLFLLFTALALALAGLPLGGLYFLAEQMTDWPPGTRQSVCLLAGALSASIFWSLATLVYLHLRSAVDATDASNVAVGPPSNKTPKTPSSEEKAAEVPASGNTVPAAGKSLVRAPIKLLAAAVGSWCLTFWLFTHASRGQAEWLGWGLSETLIPPAEGIYRVASVIAGLWGVVWVALPLLWLVRRLLSGRPPRVNRAQESNGG